jgi:hypothetical protein
LARFVALAIPIGFALRFVYILWLIRGFREWVDCPTAEHPEFPFKPERDYLPAFSFGLWGLYLFGLSYWALAGCPYWPDGQPWIDRADDISVVLMVVMAVTVIISGFALYRCGEWKGTARERLQ